MANGFEVLSPAAKKLHEEEILPELVKRCGTDLEPANLNIWLIEEILRLRAHIERVDRRTYHVQCD